MLNRCRQPLGYFSAVSIALAGCASTSQYREAGDPCSTYREPFIQAKENADESLSVGALVGAGLGLTAGLLCVAAGGSAATCSGIGGGIFLAATAIGFWQKKRQDAANQRELQQVIDQEADVSEVALSKLGHSLSTLNNCRLSQLAALQQRFDSGQANPATARTELNAIDAAPCPRSGAGRPDPR